MAFDHGPGFGPQTSVLVLAEDMLAADAAEHAAELVGASVCRVGFAQAMRCITDRPSLSTVIVETAGVSDDVLDNVLTQVDALAHDRDMRFVVSLDTPHIDQVVARVLGPHAILLCDASLSDRVAALAVAARPQAVGWGEVHDEAERLRVLNSEVARIADTLARLTRPTLERPSIVAETAPSYRSEQGSQTPPVDAGEVRAMIRLRRLRGTFFDPELFADPAWDMLLDLLAASLEHRRVSVSSLCIAAAVPGTTALRWIGTMVDAGLFERHSDPLDRRRAFISLSEKATRGLSAFFGEVRRAGMMR